MRTIEKAWLKRVLRWPFRFLQTAHSPLSLTLSASSAKAALAAAAGHQGRGDIKSPLPSMGGAGGGCKTKLALLSLLAMAFTFAWTNESRADSILSTKHNLSSSGPGEPGVTRATDQSQICVFCHVPHHAAQPVPLWSRDDPDPTNEKYTPYSSLGLEAAPGQPQGSSRLCLSCHDGSIALGMLAGGRQVSTLGSLPAGRRSNLESDLSDDHPISFPYTAATAQADGELALPGEIPAALKLEQGVNLECRTCHDPHKNTYGSFLVMSNASSALCTSCHRKNGWAAATHAVATPELTAAACESCHLPHRAGGPWLNKEMEEETCFSCHSDTGSAADIQDLVLNRASRHNVADAAKAGVHDPTEDPATASSHVECTDCHNPHAANGDPPLAPGRVSGRNRMVKGIDAEGNPVDPAVFEYEICFRCHADNAFVAATAIPRQIQQVNERLRFDTLNPSFHPTIAARNAGIPGLLDGYTSSSVISCTDCHNSDEGSRAGGMGPDGPHGSNFDPLLIARYETGDNLTPYVQDNFALCFRCHDPLDLFNAAVSGFGDQHTNHVQDRGVSCAVCHDPHGVPWQDVVDPANHKRLINFDSNVVTEPTAYFNRDTRTCYNLGTCHAGTWSY